MRKSLILVDTKMNLGLRGRQNYLIDEVFTPDSTRYFFLQGYEENFRKGKKKSSGRKIRP
jgi:phosphoribosylaminoimidazole-succinocarboxamide synthase